MTTELITRGTHQALLRSVSGGWTDKQKAEFALGFELVGEDDEDRGRFITDFNYPDASDMGFDIFVEKLRNCGWTGDEIKDLPALARDGKLDKLVDLVVDHEEYNGKWRAKVKFVNRLGGAIVQKNPMSDKELASFSERMKAKVRASTGVKRNGSPPPPAQQNLNHPNAPGPSRDAPGWGPTRVADDDIPF